MPLRYWFIDFDSFFASVEQQHRPELRGRPVGVVPSLGVETTCCIAASYEAKRFGVKTGTPVHEARRLCPGIRFVEGDHARYVRVHEAIRERVHDILYVEAVLSIDEMYGRLPPHWQPPAVARTKALEVKAALAAGVGPLIRASIGFAPNRFLAKLASKRDKPDGLVAIDLEDLPEALHRFALPDITGVGSRMLRRLAALRITDVAGLCRAERRTLHRAWGSVEGDRMWHALRGIDLPPVATRRSSVGHSHVLPPPLRNVSGACATLHRMLQKACRRLRAMDYFAGRLGITVKFGFDFAWRVETSLFPTQDSVTFAHALNGLWSGRPAGAPDPVKVAVVLGDLVSGDYHTPSLFAGDNHCRRVALQRVMDAVNCRYGGRTLYYADAMEAQRSREAAPMRIAFTHIPDLELERD